MKNTFSTLFYPKRNDADKRGNAPLYLRITVDGQRCELSVRRKVNLSQWDSTKEILQGKTAATRELNIHMSNIRIRLFKLYDKLQEENRHITASLLKESYLGKKKPEKMILEIFQEHNDEVDALVGKDFAAGTAERYRTAKKHLQDYILRDYRKSDIPVKEVNHKFITGFEYYLKSVRKCSHNTAIKYVVNFKKLSESLMQMTGLPKILLSIGKSVSKRLRENFFHRRKFNNYWIRNFILPVWSMFGTFSFFAALLGWPMQT